MADGSMVGWDPSVMVSRVMSPVPPSSLVAAVMADNVEVGREDS